MPFAASRPLVVCSLLSLLVSCGREKVSSDATLAGNYTVLGTMTDNTDRAVAKQNCESALAIHPDLRAVAGLWSYNTPQCLEALKSKGRLGEVRVFGFDEEKETLEAIEQGHCEGTIVQQPFEFGYQSMKYLKQLADGQEVSVPENRVDIPARTITRENLAEFRATLDDLRRQGEAASTSTPPAGAPKFAFIINSNSPFWIYARAGLKKAEADFGLIAEFHTPPTGSVTEQNRILESILLRKDEYAGVAISPIDPENQTDILNQVAAELPLITQDSDAPQSRRRFYIGTNNVEAGRLLGQLMRQKWPEGGKLMLFVGTLDAINARERRQGIIEALGAP